MHAVGSRFLPFTWTYERHRSERLVKAFTLYTSANVCFMRRCISKYRLSKDLNDVERSNANVIKESLYYIFRLWIASCPGEHWNVGKPNRILWTLERNAPWNHLFIYLFILCCYDATRLTKDQAPASLTVTNLSKSLNEASMRRWLEPSLIYSGGSEVILENVLQRCMFVYLTSGTSSESTNSSKENQDLLFGRTELITFCRFVFFVYSESQAAFFGNAGQRVVWLGENWCLIPLLIRMVPFFFYDWGPALQAWKHISFISQASVMAFKRPKRTEIQILLIRWTAV